MHGEQQSPNRTIVDAIFDSYNDDGRGPVVLAVTHAGRNYPVGIAERLALPLAHTLPLEDRFADRLVELAIAEGHAVLIARVPRLMIDLNRAETDFEAHDVVGVRGPSARPSHRARGGLGLVPERLGNETLWKKAIRADELVERIRSVHRPWHAALATALDRACAANGCAVLLDIHSMPPLGGVSPAQVVIGDRHGACAAPAITDAAVGVFRHAGFRVAVNQPYAGAYTLERHGRPTAGIFALQIEIDRRLYLDAAFDQPGPGLGAIQGHIAILARAMANRLMIGRPGFDIPLAAE